MKSLAVELDDKYTQQDGRIWISSLQALVRLPLEQRRRDRTAGLKTAGFISGYRGSPLGAYDMALWAAQRHLDAHDIRFMPGVNEELAAASIRGTQWASYYPEARQDGVFALWYGKHLGTERACEALKQGNYEGASEKGGVLIVTGDDMGGKSSVTAAESDHVFITGQIPLLYPANTQEILEFGLYGWALSRFSGLWVGLKTVTDTVEMSSVVRIGPSMASIVRPDVERPREGLNAFRGDYSPLAQERRLTTFRIPAAKAFVRANGLDRVVFDSPHRRLGIVAAGKVYLDVREALVHLGLDASRTRDLGIRLYKPGMVWPLEDIGARAFCEGHAEIVVVDEKRPVLEDQLARILYDLSPQRRPRLIGKRDDRGDVLIPDHGERSVNELVAVFMRRIRALGLADPALDARMRELEARREGTVVDLPASPLVRTPYFCSGCPHNSSTRTIDGSMAFTGIGCYGLLPLFMPERKTEWIAQMGAEGMPWVGMHRFIDQPHAFQNIGDGTYFHSGILAIRQAIASGANVTYKILYNGAVAMTGGQPLDGELTVEMLANQLYWEGVRSIVVVSDEPSKYPGTTRWPAGTLIRDRSELESTQRELQRTTGVSALIYDQHCAAEKRRLRKRGKFHDPPKRVFINQDVCEGCGDCSAKSNCVSVQPLETTLGRKRVIDQSSCNKDFSCIEGFCPSFVTVENAVLRKGEKAMEGGLTRDLLGNLPSPPAHELTQPYNVLLTGIGGTGVLTVGAILGMAAHLDGKAATVMDVTGMAQKGGTVLSNIRIAREPEALFAPRLWQHAADAVIGCDLVATSGAQAAHTFHHDRTRIVVNRDVVPTAQFQNNQGIDFDQTRLMTTLQGLVGPGRVDSIDATSLATALMGDSIATNIFMLGFALQKGLIPLPLTAIEEALRLNGVAVQDNLHALAWGRLAAHDRLALGRALGTTASAQQDSASPKSLDELIAHREGLLMEYQDAAYARRYRAVVDRVRATGNEALTRCVAHVLAKLMAYKDEYEVARLYTRGDFARRLARTFEGRPSLRLHLAPPLLSPRDSRTGHLRKRTFGPWIFSAFGVLARLKRLRGTPADVFGYTAERRMERGLIDEYMGLVDDVLERWSPDNQDACVALLWAYDDIRGFGHVKQANLERLRSRLPGLRARVG